MLKNIDFQISSNEQEQKQNEVQLSPLIQRRLDNNLKAFAYFDPSLAQALATHHSLRFSPFITKFKRVSVLNISKGRALYNPIPQKQVDLQINVFCQNPLVFDQTKKHLQDEVEPFPGISLNSLLPHAKLHYEPISKSSENLVILGCGLGLHIKPLLSTAAWKRVLLVEPEMDLLHVSLLSAQWRELLAQVKNSGVNFTIISGRKGSDSIFAIKEWMQHHEITKFHIFRHYDYSMFNGFEFDTLSGRSPFSESLLKYSEELEKESSYEFSQPLAHYFIHNEDNAKVVETYNRKCLSSIFDKNLCAFKKYFPEIYDFSSNYKLSRWQLLSTGKEQFNLFDLERASMFCSEDPHVASSQYFEHYSAHPRIDSLDAREPLHKPSPFIHYDKAKALRALVRDVPDNKETQTKLPYKLPSFIMYGCGLAYQVELLFKRHDIDNFILYEPNVEFFLASLFTIDWSSILEKADERGSKLYLNIGDDGTHMFDDIHQRLQSYGIHILSYTFFYVSYYHHQMHENVLLTREQFKVLLNVGEFFDHAFYNLNHTQDSFSHNHPYMLKYKPKGLSQILKATPVFIIGNGPSLDSSADVIKSYKNKAIIVSVGTSLKALYNLGIKPDFHAEVEQTRATLHWVSQVPDPDWLKSIDLISVNGLHPEVVDMFGDPLFCLKTGEAGACAFSAISDEVKEFSSLLYSYPTVSNCALSYVLALGFRQVYLFGVDLGFVDPKCHHSKHSAYFNSNDKGKELYDYSAHGTGIRVRGNFADNVFTKHEFKFSAEILSKAISEFPDAEIYNTSNGAFIEGTTALQLDQVLLLNENIDKVAMIQNIKAEAYNADTKKIVNKFDQHYKFDNFERQCNEFLSLIDADVESWEEALDFLDKQVDFVKKSSLDVHSLFYYLLRGSCSFCLTYLTHLAYFSDDEALCMQKFEEGKDIWREYVAAARDKVMNDFGEFDRTPLPYPGVGFDSLPALEILKKQKARMDGNGNE
ncbi:motility associated factor glycosyltransferase family protein [Agarivorans sp. QJM3NY_29]|uniref:motility associated factor glycosyltransferase family protein n=1 Tax=unclassified Agarivorans TaxID=2636026 RepID=UPI003D7D2DD5